MTDRRAIVSILLVLPLAGCGNSLRSESANTAEQSSPAASHQAQLIPVAAWEAARALHETPPLPAVRAQTTPDFDHTHSDVDTPTAIDERRLAAEPPRDALPPSLDWREVTQEGLLIPPADRAAVPIEQFDLHDAPLPDFQPLLTEPTVAVDEPADRAAVDALGRFAHRPAIVARTQPSRTKPANDRAGAQPNGDFEQVNEQIAAMRNPRGWLAGSDATGGGSESKPSVDSPADEVPHDLAAQRVFTNDEPVAEQNHDDPLAAETAADLFADATTARADEAEVPSQPEARPAPIAGAERARSLPLALSPAQMAEMTAVARLADAHSKRGFELAGRNALYSARAEFVQALGMVAQGLDAAERGTTRMEAMAAALKALEESDQFVASSTQLATEFDAVIVARPHATPVLRDHEPGTTSAMQALQLYYGYAQRQLEFAAGRQPAASMALHGLGKVHAAMAKTNRARSGACEPKAIVFFQAALLSDPRNFMSANELGVLLANYGKYPQAKAAFVQSLRVSGQPVTWRNLAVVHSHLGERHMAQLAVREAHLAAQRGIDRHAGPLGLSARPFDVQWVDANSFAQVPESPAISAKTAADTKPLPVTSLPPRAPTPVHR